jgi:hypothetical protein
MEAAPTLRGHHLLCLLAFSGEGYSPAFTQRFVELASVYRDPHSRVRVVVGPDGACAACPHLSTSGCTSPTDGPEDSVAALDQAVLDALGISPGTWLAGELHSRVARLDRDALSSLCSRCSWFGRTSCQDLILGFSERTRA